MIDLALRQGLRKTTVKLYDNIDQLPIERFNKANKFWMLHDNIGSSIGDFDRVHYAKLMLLVKEGKKDQLIKELANLRVMIYNIMNELNVEHMSFACLVHSIDEKECNDFSNEALKNVIKRLSDAGLTQDVLKKKLMRYAKASTKI